MSPVRKILLGVAGVVVVAGLAVLLGAFRSIDVAPGVDQPLSAEQMKALVPRGRELTLAGDCLGCHSTADGPLAAGGVPLDTPFGKVFSANITPDPDYGIGKFTRADFHRTMKHGIGKGGRNLYPAMPFVYTQVTTPEDIDAIYAYIMSLPPIAKKPPQNTGVFLLPVRPFLNFWTPLNVPQRSVPKDPTRSAAWNRGAYLVEGLGHCGSCHTPMNIMMGPQFSKSLQGAVIEGYEAPPLLAHSLAARGYDTESLTEFLATGMSAQGTSFGPMHTVTRFSTSAMKRSDVEAIATYLLTAEDGKIPPPSPPPTRLEPGKNDDPGRLLYVNACAGCHGVGGEGIPNVAPALRGNSTVALANPLNLVTVIVNGVPTQRFTGNQRMYAMPGFANELSDEEIAQLATWVRAEHGGLPQPVTARDVSKIERTSK